MAKFSTGLRNAMLANSSLASALATGLVKIYAGTPPASADAALGAATLLCTVSTNSTGTALAFETAAVNGVLSKKAADVWSEVGADGHLRDDTVSVGLLNRSANKADSWVDAAVDIEAWLAAQELPSLPVKARARR